MVKSIIISQKDAKPKTNHPTFFCKISVKMSLYLPSLFYQPWTCLNIFASFLILLLILLVFNSWKSAAICINATWWWWWCYPTPFEGWERREIPLTAT